MKSNYRKKKSTRKVEPQGAAAASTHGPEGRTKCNSGWVLLGNVAYSQMAGSSVHLLRLGVQDTQPSQACNGSQGTAGRDQTLKMDEGFFFFQVAECRELRQRRTTNRSNTVQNADWNLDVELVFM